MTAALLFCASAGLPYHHAQAFSLFGYHLWGEKEQASSIDVDVPDPTPYKVDFTFQDTPPDGIESELKSKSVLVSEIEQLPSGASGVLARANRDFERLIATLYADGYYGGLVAINIAGTPLKQAILHPDKLKKRPVPIVVHVTVGPQFAFGSATVRYDGDILRHDADSLPDAQQLGLIAGEPALSDKVLDAEKQAVLALTARGFPFAKVEDRSLLANHADRQLKVSLVLDSGPYARFGPVTVSGTEKVDPEFVRGFANIPQGTQWDEKVLQAAEDRLRGLEVFSSIRFQPADQLDMNGELPIMLIVEDRPGKVYGFGANYSSNEGLGINGYWRNRNLFGQAERLTVSGSVGQLIATGNEEIEYAARVTFEKPGVFDPQTSFSTSFAAVQENPDNFRSKSISYDAYLQRQFTDALWGRAGGELYFANENDVFGINDYFLVGIPAEVKYDTRNDALNPITGLDGRVRIEPAYDFTGKDGLFFSEARLAGFYPLLNSDRFVLAGRASVGSIIAPSSQSVPASRRFFLGGGGTIRGYAYKNVGPRIGDEVAGGRSFLLFNGELRTRVTENFGLVGFVDAGTAYSTIYPDFAEPFSVGVGGGIRYFTPVGPLRLDVGLPLEPRRNDPSFAVYVGLGQAF